MKSDPADGNPSEDDLRKASEERNKKIADPQARNGLPADPALGNPKWEKGAADERNDLPPDDDEN